MPEPISDAEIAAMEARAEQVRKPWLHCHRYVRDHYEMSRDQLRLAAELRAARTALRAIVQADFDWLNFGYEPMIQAIKAARACLADGETKKE